MEAVSEKSFQEQWDAAEKAEKAERNRKRPFEIAKAILVWIVIILICRELFTNTKEDAIVSAPYYKEPEQILLVDPYKESLKTKIKLPHTEAMIKPQASYKISARVIAKSRILGDGVSELVPYDVGLVWGDLMKDKNYRKITFHQYQRWVTWQVSAKTMQEIGYLDIPKHVSNNHLIPANKNILDGIRKIKKYDKIYLEGYLVYCDITYKKSPLFQYNSSLSREDTGDHACEIFYVTKIISSRGSWQ